MDRGKLTLISCDSGKHFYNKVVKEIKKLVNHSICLPGSEEYYFANGEVKTIINKNIRGNDVYIFQNIDDPRSEKNVNDNFFALLTAIDAARYADADSITAVIPQFPYARQERRKTREGITAKLIARYLESAGVDRIITLDIHSEAIQGFFPKAKLENLHASSTFIDYFKSLNLNKETSVVVAPDMGSTERARIYSNALHFGIAVIDKERNYAKASTIANMKLLGDVKNKDLIIVDDMIATGGTLISAITELKKHGANDIYIATSLPYFNGNAVEKFDEAYKNGIFKKILGTDAVNWGEEFSKNHPWYEEVSMAPLFARVIYNINHKLSVSALLKTNP
jgi:ribose-phosphate pyrophosphokinase